MQRNSKKDLMKEEPDIETSKGEQKKVIKSPRIERNIRIKVKQHKNPE